MQGDSIKVGKIPFDLYEMGQTARDCKRDLVCQQRSAYPARIDAQDTSHEFSLRRHPRPFAAASGP